MFFYENRFVLILPKFGQGTLFHSAEDEQTSLKMQEKVEQMDLKNRPFKLSNANSNIDSSQCNYTVQVESCDRNYKLQ